MRGFLLTVLLSGASISAAASAIQNVPYENSLASINAKPASLIGKKLFVKGHLWIGKEGSMIYEGNYENILRTAPSDAFSKKNGNWFTYFSRHPGSTREVVVVGHLENLNNKLLLRVDDIIAA